MPLEDITHTLASEPPIYFPPILQSINANQGPKPVPACATCPASLWYNSRSELNCYCSRMHRDVFGSGAKASPIFNCDGRELAIRALSESKERQM